ncbi:dnaJ, partial [Symbiodinium microadriaticum]
YYEKSEAGPNFFQLLGVGRDSTESDIKKAFRNLSRILHPDKNKSPDAALEFQKVQHAYQ